MSATTDMPPRWHANTRLTREFAASTQSIVLNTYLLIFLFIPRWRFDAASVYLRHLLAIMQRNGADDVDKCWRQSAGRLVAGASVGSLLILVSFILVSAAGDSPGAGEHETATGRPGSGGNADSLVRNDSSQCESQAVSLGAQQEKALSVSTNSSLLYECEISYMQMDMSLIKFSINYLELQPASNAGCDAHNNTLIGAPREDGKFRLPELSGAGSPSELALTSKLNASLPFVFFINGFNTFGPCE